MKKFLVAGFAAVTACAAAFAAAPPADAWQIGPIIRGKNYSVGISGTLLPGPAGPWFNFPTTGRGHIHYVTLPVRPIEGARQITVRYRIDAAPGARFVAQEDGAEGAFGLVFQRAGDNWSAKGRYEAYRWYSPDVAALKPGVHTFTARLDDPRWKGVMRSTAASNPAAFAGALRDTESVSMTFGSEGARGHGVYATAPAKFTLIGFGIE